MGKQPETRFKEKVLRDLEQLEKDKGISIYCLKTQMRAQRGVPDLILCLTGAFVAIELKVDGEKPTKLQEISINSIREAGGIAFYTTPTEWPRHLEVLKEACK